VSADLRIGRLQLLLERVQERAAGPRGDGAAYAAAPAHDEAAISEAPETPALVRASVNPAAYPSEPPAAESYDADADVEVSSEVVEVDIDIDEAMAMESGAQPVAQQTMPPEDLLEEVDEAPLTTQPPGSAPMHDHDEELTQTAPANEIEEPTPSSSRRPIAGEEAAAGAYEEESAPRHTPPPESGRQVAAAPSNHPPSRKPSAPPPSLEGHTLIGGWREPGLGPQPTPPVGTPGVRVSAPGRGPAPAVAAPQASGTRLTPDVTEPRLAASANVASFVGAPPAPKPTTLGELLDMTLSL
jgi:hypothetical protein